MSQGIEAGKAFVRLGLDPASLDAGIKSAQAKLRGFASTARGLGTAFLGVGTAIVAPLGLAVQEASDLQETMNKFNVVFGENAGAVKKWGDDYAGAVGRSKKQVAEFLSETQDLLKPMGFAGDAATAMSKDVTRLAVDLASFNNMADADVLRDLKAALTGSGEVMKKYGVIVSEAAVKQELLNMGMDPKNVTEMEKAQARFNIILRGTTDAQGDAERSAGAFANQMKKLWGQVADTAAVVGMALIPALETGLKAVNGWLPAMAKWVEENAALVPLVAAVGLGISALGAGLLTASVFASAAAAALGLVSAVIGAIGLPIAAAVVALAALGVTAVALGTDFEVLKTQVSAALGDISASFKAAGFEGVWEAIWISIQETTYRAIASILRGLATLSEEVVGFLAPLTNVLPGAAGLATSLGAKVGAKGGALGLRQLANTTDMGADALAAERSNLVFEQKRGAELDKKLRERNAPPPEPGTSPASAAEAAAAMAVVPTATPEDIAEAIAGITGGGAGPIDLGDNFTALSDEIRGLAKQGRESKDGDPLLIAAQATAQNTLDILQEVRAGGTLQ